MKVKRFIARDEQEAMIKVKSELGRDAIILHTRKIKKQGLKAWFSKPLVEVVAAIEEGPSMARGNNSRVTSHVPEKKNPYIREDIQSKATEERMDILQVLNSNKSKNMEPIKGIQKDKEDINDEISSIKSMLSSVLNSMESGKLGVNVIREDYKQALTSVGISEPLVKIILDKVEEKTTFNEKNKDLINDLTIQVIKEYLGEPTELTIEQTERPQIVFFIGPTGVGKTTTIAKLAARESIINNKQVALITSDTYRIAAVDQLKTYSEILNIPISVIYEAKEIDEEIKKYAEMDYIFVDTAGRNHKNKELVNEISDLLKYANKSSVYLLLSLTTGYHDVENIVNAYSFIEDYNIIFTKSDEASVLGNVLNIKYLTNKPLSYITTGQSVPDDIEVINIEKIANQLVGG